MKKHDININQWVARREACNLLKYITFLNGSFDTKVPVTPRLDAIFASPLALRTTGNQYRLLATADYRPSRSLSMAGSDRAEVSHEPTRLRERQMRRFKSAGQAQRFLAVYGVVGNLFRLGRHLTRAVNYRAFRQRAFCEWQEVTCAHNMA